MGDNKKGSIKSKNNIKAINHVLGGGSAGLYDAGAGMHWIDPSMTVPTITSSNAGRLYIIRKEINE